MNPADPPQPSQDSDGAPKLPAATSANQPAPRATDDPACGSVCETETATSATTDPVEDALCAALKAATEAGRWDVVAQLAGELKARREALSAGNVVPIETARKRGAR